jgi:hypothetical protein
VVDGVLVAVVAVAAMLVVPACGWGSDDEPRDGLGADTAWFSYGGRRAEVPLADCGQEGDVVVLAGTQGGIVVQAAADLGDGGAARSGVTADLGGEDGILGAFGAEHDDGPAGEITDVRVEGDRVTIEGRWAPLDGDLRPLPVAPDQLIEGALEARCPETDLPTD